MTTIRIPRRAVSACILAGVALGAAAMTAVPAVEAPRDAGRGDPVVTEASQSRDHHNRRVRVHNQTGWTMSRFYASHSRSNGRERDILGAEALPPGGSWTLNIDDGSGACVFEFKAEFTNGHALIRQNVNVCQIADYYYTR